jgi:putative DNA primase/helicase
MENTQLNNPDSQHKRQGQDTQKTTEPVKINPQFDDLKQPEILVNHVLDLTQSKATPHEEILSQLLEQFDMFDFEEIANPHNTEDFKLNNKHFTVLSIENVIQVATNNRWGLCKHHDFIYLFNGTYWDEINKETFQKFLGEAAEQMGVPTFSARYFRFRKELYEQFLGTAYLDPKPTLANKVLINLKNGTFEVSIEGTHLRPFDRSDFLTYQLPFEYNPKAKAPLFEAYINKVLPDKERQKVLAEYLGFVFIKHGSNQLKEEKALILYGTGANGKSVFFEIVSALLGTENISNYSLQSLTDSTGYYRAKLANKLVNYGSEINGKLESSLFKQMVSGEPVEARLPYGHPFVLKQYAKLIFNSNELPKDVEHTNAYFRRFLIIPFDVTIPPQEQDKQLHTKIIESELSGVFNWVLDGLKRLLKQKGFTDCEAAKQAVEQYKSQSDSVKMFIDENNYGISPTDYTLIKELYFEYRSYCCEDGFRPVNKTNFIKRLGSYGFVIERRNVGNVAYLSK